MKIRHLLLMCSAAALPQLATADLSITDPAGLGQVKALLDFCSASDSRDATSFKAEWQSIVGGQSGLLAQIEQNSAYKQQYTEFTGELQKMPREQTVKICAVDAAQWKGIVGSHDGDHHDGDHHDGDHGKDDRDPKPDKDSDRQHKSGHDR